MNFASGTALFLSAHALGLLLGAAQHATAQGYDSKPSNTATPTTPLPLIAEWSSAKAQHAYGLPEVKPNEKGTLTIDSAGLSFTAAKGVSSYRIPRSSLLAVNSGDERVELWGTKGRLLRMAIPQGGGLAAAGVMHHKVNMLSVEFKDPKEAYHAAVFYLPAGEAEHVLSSFAELPPSPHGLTSDALRANTSVCGTGGSINPHSVLLRMPAWNQSNVPSAYRDLVYEHTIDRLKKVKDVGHVYREGEVYDASSCPQYVIHISVFAFKQGSQVQRAMTGPIGFFVGTTQMAYTVNITDASRSLNVTDQMKSTLRGEGESRNVADSVAKSIAKRYATEMKKAAHTQAAIPRIPCPGPACFSPTPVV